MRLNVKCLYAELGRGISILVRRLVLIITSHPHSFLKLDIQIREKYLQLVSLFLCDIINRDNISLQPFQSQGNDCLRCLRVNLKTTDLLIVR